METFAQYVLATSLLYLRVSGQFHLIVLERFHVEDLLQPVALQAAEAGGQTDDRVSGVYRSLPDEAATHVPDREANILHVLESGLFHPFLRLSDGVVASMGGSRHVG
jgi:hypothetical protein